MEKKKNKKDVTTKKSLLKRMGEFVKEKIDCCLE